MPFSHPSLGLSVFFLSFRQPALQQIENAHRKGMPEGLRDWERGGLLEAIACYRSKLEAVVFMWVPAHVGIACNAYADADCWA